MNARVRVTSLVGALLTIASAIGLGCGDSSGGGELDVIVDPAMDLRAADAIVGCPRGPQFPASALGDLPLLAQSQIDGMPDSVEPFLATRKRVHVATDRWRVLDAQPSRVLLVRFPDRHIPRQSIAFMGLRRSGQGWRLVALNKRTACPLSVQLPS